MQISTLGAVGIILLIFFLFVTLIALAQLYIHKRDEAHRVANELNNSKMVVEMIKNFQEEIKELTKEVRQK